MKLHTLSYLKRVTGHRTTRLQVPHVLALAPRDAKTLELTLINNETERYWADRAGRDWYDGYDMRSWRPRDGWAISRTDQAWLDVPTDYVIVYRSEVNHDR